MSNLLNKATAAIVERHFRLISRCGCL